MYHKSMLSLSFIASRHTNAQSMDLSLMPTRYIRMRSDVRVSGLNTVCLALCFRFVRTGAASRSSRDWRLSAQPNLPLADGEVLYQTLRYTIIAYSLADRYLIHD